MWRVFVFAAVASVGFWLTGLVVAVMYLPWWAWLAAAGTLLTLELAARLFVSLWTRRFLRRLEAETPEGMPQAFTALFMMKGSPLRGARVDVHSLTPVPSPPDEPWRHYDLETTVRPTGWGIGFRLWQPGELRMEEPGGAWADGGDACRVLSVEVFDGREYGADGMRYRGARRLRLRLAVRPGVRRLAFRYYTEQFGDVVLPEPAAGLLPE